MTLRAWRSQARHRRVPAPPGRHPLAAGQLVARESTGSAQSDHDASPDALTTGRYAAGMSRGVACQAARHKATTPPAHELGASRVGRSIQGCRPAGPAWRVGDRLLDWRLSLPRVSVVPLLGPAATATLASGQAPAGVAHRTRCRRRRAAPGVWRRRPRGRNRQQLATARPRGRRGQDLPTPADLGHLIRCPE